MNYKFDSVSSAGKISGTALDLIKRYNELAKEAQSHGDYVDMEVFRQYAEHYRKIVTEINARKNQTRETSTQEQAAEVENTITNIENTSEQTTANNNLVETQAAPRVQPEQISDSAEKQEKPKICRLKRGFTVIEVTNTQTEPKTGADGNEQTIENPTTSDVVEPQKPKRRRIGIKKSTGDDVVVKSAEE